MLSEKIPIYSFDDWKALNIVRKSWIVDDAGFYILVKIKKETKVELFFFF